MLDLHGCGNSQEVLQALLKLEHSLPVNTEQAEQVSYRIAGSWQRCWWNYIYFSLNCSIQNNAAQYEIALFNIEYNFSSQSSIITLNTKYMDLYSIQNNSVWMICHQSFLQIVKTLLDHFPKENAGHVRAKMADLLGRMAATPAYKCGRLMEQIINILHEDGEMQLMIYLWLITLLCNLFFSMCWLKFIKIMFEAFLWYISWKWDCCRNSVIWCYIDLISH